MVTQMMSKKNDAEFQDIASKMQKQGIEAIDNGMKEQFSNKTLDSFGVKRDALEKRGGNPYMISDKLVLFVSSTMPIDALRAFARDLSKVGGVMVIRGALGHRDYLATRAWIWSILKKDKNCNAATCVTWRTQVNFDPVLFEMYNIKQVPALIYQPDMQIASYCDDLDSAVKAKAIAYGNAFLGDLIDSLSRQDKSNEIQLNELRAKL